MSQQGWRGIPGLRQACLVVLCYVWSLTNRAETITWTSLIRSRYSFPPAVGVSRISGAKTKRELARRYRAGGLSADEYKAAKAGAEAALRMQVGREDCVDEC